MLSFYEPVTLQKRGYARPVIVLGPLKEDINDKLVNDFPEKFAGCVPHTTRKARQGEVDGRDYHFVTSVEQMERDIQAHLFIEAGRYKDNLYGTSIQAVREVAEQNKHCILGVSGYAIKRLHLADLLPIAICIQPDGPNVIKSAQPRISDENAQVIYDKGRGIQQDFADSFTAVVEGSSLEEIYDKVKQVIHDNSSDLIWVTSSEEI
ncbi:PREDICTED: disks large homolog 3-like [Amphimedon queenslandica]|uniref:Guanylate kinase-like domain-containing protein n=1 Tax=Amphimedon queenslandica TaxID=400682 RepID=A0A1X7SZS8_AMPQE|nr:PREDICTED: disks large homolog 3-like [Amphimedon queenslandica]|eukprot:XP_003391362.2 PREDICTED: disks large homolog 3-like [Amphimedon queenslandica]